MTEIKVYFINGNFIEIKDVRDIDVSDNLLMVEKLTEEQKTYRSHIFKEWAFVEVVKL
jgi:hypothetical protein